MQIESHASAVLRGSRHGAFPPRAAANPRAAGAAGAGRTRRGQAWPVSNRAILSPSTVKCQRVRMVPQVELV
ncbi:hypothetical protein GCM10009605_50100 [Nocardiopsis composta]